MERLPLQHDIAACPLALAVDLPSSEVDPFFPSRPDPLDHLAHALARGVVRVVRSAASAEVGSLHLVGVRVRDFRQVRHRHHVAIGIMGVRRAERSRLLVSRQTRGVQSVAGRHCRSACPEGIGPVGVLAAPGAGAAVAGVVEHLPDVADFVVVVHLGVGPERLCVVRVRQVPEGEVVGVPLDVADAARVLSPCRRDQPVDRVVRELLRGRDLLAGEEDILLRVVANRRDVADRIVEVEQVLQLRAVSRARGAQSGEPEAQGS